MKQRIYFEDKGQDFLWWDIDNNDTGLMEVVDCGPFQASVWVGHFILNEVAVGVCPTISKSPKDEVLTLNYAIEKIEDWMIKLVPSKSNPDAVTGTHGG